VASDIVYSVYDYTVSPANGQIGRANFNGTNTIANTVTNITAHGSGGTITPDAKVFWFLNADGVGRILVAETYYPTSSSPGQAVKISVYDTGLNGSGSSWGTQVYPAVNTTVTLANAVNIYAVARDGKQGLIYLIDYDMHTVYGVTNTSGDNYGFTSGVVSYSYDGDGDASMQCYGVDLAVIGNGKTGGDYDADVCALFIRGTNVFGGSYDTSALLKLSKNLTTVNAKNTNLAKNAFCIRPYAGDLYIAAMGGAQHYDDSWNPESRIQKAAQSDLNLINLLRAAVNDGEGKEFDQADFRDIAFKVAANGEVFILRGQFGSSGFTGRLLRTTMGVLATANPDPVLNPEGVLESDLAGANGFASYAITGVSGYFWALLYLPDDGMVLLARGNELAVCQYSNGAVVIAGGGSAVIGMGSGTGDLAPASCSLNAMALIGHSLQLKGAQDPNKVSVKAPKTVHAAKAKAKGKEEER
jgi:hypothetical protein